MKLNYWFLLFCLVFGSCGREASNALRIYPEQVISANFIGNGVQWSAYPHADTENAEWGKLMTDEKWNMNFFRLDYMRPQIFRVLDQANWRYLVGFDENNNPIWDFNTPEVKAVEKILDYAQKNNITVLLGEWGTPYKVHDTGQGFSHQFSGADDPKWINGIVEYLDYLINTRGYSCIKYFNLVNEPNGNWASTNGNFAEWSAGVKLLAEELKKRGLDKFVSVAGPDAVTRYDNPNSSYTGVGWVEQTIKQIDKYIGLYDVHDYTDHDLVKSGQFEIWHGQVADLVSKTHKPIIFGELGFSRNNKKNQERIKADPFAGEDSQMEVYDFSYGIYMADAAIQSMRAGYAGSIAWALDDAMHTVGDLGNKNQLKRWGMWNSLGTEICNNPEDENIRPWFYTWSLLCRYFPKGCNIVKTDDPKIEGLRLTAGVYHDRLTVAVVNNSDVDHSVSILVPFEHSLKVYRYTEGQRPVDTNGFPVPVDKILVADNVVNIKVPANSFVLLTSLNE